MILLMGEIYPRSAHGRNDKEQANSAKCSDVNRLGPPDAPIAMATIEASGQSIQLARRQVYPFSVHLPLLITTTSRSFTRARNEAILPSFQISTAMVSPGKTGEEKRTSKPVILVGS